MVLCAQKDEEGLDLDCSVPQATTSRGLCVSEIEAKRPVAVCGKRFLKPIGQDTATPIFGMPTKR